MDQCTIGAAPLAALATPCACGAPASREREQEIRGKGVFSRGAFRPAPAQGGISGSILLSNLRLHASAEAVSRL